MSLILNDDLSNFDILLQNNKDTHNHHRNIQANEKWSESFNYELYVYDEK